MTDPKAPHNPFPDNKDRKTIVAILKAYSQDPSNDTNAKVTVLINSFQNLIMHTRGEAFGWMHAYVCASLDEGKDPRSVEVPTIIEAGMAELTGIVPPTEPNIH